MSKITENSHLRFYLALLASVTAGVLMASHVDMIALPLSILVAILTIFSGVLSTKLLVAASPRRESPSRLGGMALIIFLAIYCVVGKTLWADASIVPFAIYLLVGAIYVWLIFTSVAETSLLSSYCIGGFCSCFLGVLCIDLVPFFSVLTSQISTPAESTTLYTSLAFVCAISGSFAAISTRMSGWGLIDSTRQITWAFTPTGRLFLLQENNSETHDTNPDASGAEGANSPA